MANKTNKTTTLATTDVEFEPYCEWQKDDKSDTLAVYLPGFKKDQLRVQVNNLGVLKVSGARPVYGGRMSSFQKEAKMPQGCNTNDIRAEFINGRLLVLMPKKIAPPSLVQQEEQPASTSLAHPQAPKPEVAPKPEEDGQAGSAEHAQMGRVTEFDQRKDHIFGFGSSLARLQVVKKVSVSYGIAMVAMVAIGIYVAYK